MIRALEVKGGWRSTIQRWEALEGTLRLSRGCRNRCILVSRRSRVANDRNLTALAVLEQERPPEPGDPTTSALNQGLGRPENLQPTAAHNAGNGGPLASTTGFGLT